MEVPHFSEWWQRPKVYFATTLGISCVGLVGFFVFTASTDEPAEAGLSTPSLTVNRQSFVASIPAKVISPTESQARPVPSLPTEPPDLNGRDLSPDLSDYVNRGENPKMAEVIERLHAAGVFTGLGAFSPPGTRSPLLGLAVPEDFVLPSGYVRHHQVTDDGQRIEAILMFAPDQAFLDGARRPIEIPKNRVVPPHMAPAGLPIRQIVIPAVLD